MRHGEDCGDYQPAVARMADDDEDEGGINKYGKLNPTVLLEEVCLQHLHLVAASFADENDS